MKTYKVSLTVAGKRVETIMLASTDSQVRTLVKFQYPTAASVVINEKR